MDCILVSPFLSAMVTYSLWSEKLLFSYQAISIPEDILGADLKHFSLGIRFTRKSQLQRYIPPHLFAWQSIMYGPLLSQLKL